MQNYTDVVLLYWSMFIILGLYHYYKPLRKKHGQSRMGRAVPNRIR